MHFQKVGVMSALPSPTFIQYEWFVSRAENYLIVSPTLAIVSDTRGHCIGEGGWAIMLKRLCHGCRAGSVWAIGIDTRGVWALETSTRCLAKVGDGAWDAADGRATIQP